MNNIKIGVRKMKIKRLLFVICFLGMFPALSQCEDEGYKKIGSVYVPGSMDTIKKSDVNLIVPKGGQVQKQSSFLVGETPDEYSSRKFVDVEADIKDIKKELEAQKEELKKLKDIIEDINSR